MIAAKPQIDDELRDLYRDLILDHARNPRHFGALDDATHSAEGINPLCGDKLRLDLQLDSDERIVRAGFEGSGCAISLASASMLTDMVVGLSARGAIDIFTAFIEHMRNDNPAQAACIDLGKLRALDGVREFPVRVKCATLAWHALHSAINKQAMPVSTE